MPRTKVIKNSKRNREAANREEKIRQYESCLDQYIKTFDMDVSVFLTGWDNNIRMLLRRTSKALLETKIRDFCNMKSDNLIDRKLNKDQLTVARSLVLDATNSTLIRSIKVVNPNDEGYLTEDSTNGTSNIGPSTQIAFLNSSVMRVQQQRQLSCSRLRTPGPLNSARARRPRRSRSACGFITAPGSAIKTNCNNNLNNLKTNISQQEHQSRNKLRTPMASRNKAHSADRSNTTEYSESSSPPAAFLRWPKPGELVLSKCGSPLVAQVLPDKFANVNIPIRNGVISLRPKKLGDLQLDILDKIEPETMGQLKTIHANLDKIFSRAEKVVNNN